MLRNLFVHELNTRPKARSRGPDGRPYQSILIATYIDAVLEIDSDGTPRDIHTWYIVYYYYYYYYYYFVRITYVRDGFSRSAYAKQHVLYVCEKRCHYVHLRLLIGCVVTCNQYLSMYDGDQCKIPSQHPSFDLQFNHCTISNVPRDERSVWC